VIALLLIAAISWTSVGDKAAAFLDAHPNADPAQLSAALKGDELDVDALKLAPSVWLVAGSYPKNGTFFIVAPDAQGRQRVQWDIKTLAQTHFARRDDIGKWAWTESGWGDGPLLPAIGIATASRAGHPRFYVDATSDADAGGTYAKQISVWEWNGHEALPLFIKSYRVSYDTGAGKIAPGLLTLHTKGEFKTFFSCGGCVEPEMVWRIEITPDGVRDRGTQDVVPELRQFDDLVDRIVHKRPTAKFASPSAVKALRDVLLDDETFPVGMLMDWKLTNGVLRIDSDAINGNVLRLRIKDGYITLAGGS
jgi:hypothetical protein